MAQRKGFDVARILGVDLGDVRTGLAVSDPDGKMAFGVCTLTEYNKDRLMDRIASKAHEKGAQTIVFGLPVNMDGSKGFRAQAIEEFAAAFTERYGFTVVFSDERCSTMLAHTYLNASNVTGKKRKQVVDTLSAEIILQSYLDKQKNIKQN